MVVHEAVGLEGRPEGVCIDLSSHPELIDIRRVESLGQGLGFHMQMEGVGLGVFHRVRSLVLFGHCTLIAQLRQHVQVHAVEGILHRRGCGFLHSDDGVPLRNRK